MRHLVCAGQPWGERVFDRVSRELHARAGWHCWFAPNGGGSGSALLETVARLLPRYTFFLNWSRYVPASVLGRCECVNFHCTALPYGRGGHPIENLILRGHTETVMTAYRMNEFFDAGPIYGTRGPISLAGTKMMILERFVDPCADLIRWIATTEPLPTPQVGVTMRFGRLSPEAYDQFWATRA